MLLPGNNSTVGKLSQISMLCGQTELLIKERYFNKTRSGYVNSLFFVFCLAQAATRTQSFAIEERRPRPKGYETSRPHATSGWRGPFTRLFFFGIQNFRTAFMRHLTKHTGSVACQNGLFYLFVFENGRHKMTVF